jgi:hypothetical protein
MRLNCRAQKFGNASFIIYAWRPKANKQYSKRIQLWTDVNFVARRSPPALQPRIHSLSNRSYKKHCDVMEQGEPGIE